MACNNTLHPLKYENKLFINMPLFTFPRKKYFSLILQ